MVCVCVYLKFKLGRALGKLRGRIEWARNIDAGLRVKENSYWVNVCGLVIARVAGYWDIDT